MKKLLYLTKSKFISLFISITMFLSLASVTAQAVAPPPELNSQGVVLLDSDTGQVLYSKNGEQQFYPASTTKIITALIVLENSKLDEVATVSKTAAEIDGTSIGLKEGEQFKVEELLLGLILESGNDCAIALAEHVAGSIEEFAKLMNEKAKEIGANNSNFKNPSGLPDPEHVTTAHDLALFMKEVIKNPDFIRIARTNSIQMSPSNIDGTQRWINNHNYIINPNSVYFYKYSVASKKGYTTKANFTNIISAEKDGHTLIGSFLNGEGINQVYSDVAKLFDYGFDNFEKTQLYSKGQEVGSTTLEDGTVVPLIAEEDKFYTCLKDEKPNLKFNLDYTLPKSLNSTTFKTGDNLTTAKILVNDQEFDSINLNSGVNHEYSPLKIANNSNFNELKLVALIAIITIALFIINKKRRVRSIRKAQIKKGSLK
ncbi:D-alanyl-D-alanine carboxypeptidase family protein [uncultured Clostridium sp.]|uniref:D-alanyl-D-alanine carboxypeptidase family protein n=1 Tax=uncultured Clostridium sp. TaxID=59620 RepID=UPI0025D60A16|nr:D-alanyl-D-alanine carboxypeptidase family protein [uncultured Clostridium sp.]